MRITLFILSTLSCIFGLRFINVHEDIVTGSVLMLMAMALLHGGLIINSVKDIK